MGNEVKTVDPKDVRMFIKNPETGEEIPIDPVSVRDAEFDFKLRGLPTQPFPKDIIEIRIPELDEEAKAAEAESMLIELFGDNSGSPVERRVRRHLNEMMQADQLWRGEVTEHAIIHAIRGGLAEARIAGEIYDGDFAVEKLVLPPSQHVPGMHVFQAQFHKGPGVDITVLRVTVNV